MHRRRVMDRPQVTPPGRAIRHRLRTRRDDELVPNVRGNRQPRPRARLPVAYSAGVGSSPAGTTLRCGAWTPIAVTTAAKSMKPASA
jgi:hypothetical protein